MCSMLGWIPRSCRRCAGAAHRMPAEVDDGPGGIQVAPPIAQHHRQHRRSRHERACGDHGEPPSKLLTALPDRNSAARLSRILYPHLKSDPGQTHHCGSAGCDGRRCRCPRARGTAGGTAGRAPCIPAGSVEFRPVHSGLGYLLNRIAAQNRNCVGKISLKFISSQHHKRGHFQERTKSNICNTLTHTFD